jgi:hypothetical protein
MPGLVPGIHVFHLSTGNEDVDARDKRGHDCDLIDRSLPSPSDRKERLGQ